jgi:hypothetical protein
MVLAKQRGIVPSVGDRLKRLQEAGLWISADVIALLKQKAGAPSISANLRNIGKSKVLDESDLANHYCLYSNNLQSIFPNFLLSL